MNFLVQQPELFGGDTAALGAEAGIFAAIMAFAAVFFVIAIGIYVYTALVLMTLAKKTNTPNPWLAWIPIGNIYLLTQIAGVQWWTMFAIFLSAIPVIGQLGVTAVGVWWWWKISERMNKPGWWGVLMIIPIVNFVMMGILAWGESGTTPAAQPKPAEKPAAPAEKPTEEKPVEPAKK